MLVIDSDAFPRKLAARLRSGLKKADLPCSLAKSLEMAAHILEQRSWSDLKAKIGPTLVFQDDDEIGSDTAVHRRTFHVGCLVRDGVPAELATQLISEISPLSPRAFRLKADEDGASGVKLPRWRDSGDRRRTYSDVFDGSEDRWIRTADIVNNPDFESEISNLKAEFDALQTTEDMGAFFVRLLAQTNRQVEVGEDGWPIVSTPEEYRQAQRLQDEANRDAGIASTWEVREVRAFKLRAFDQWDVSLGDVIGTVILIHGNEVDNALTQLIIHGFLDMRCCLFETFIVDRGIAIIDQDRRCPILVLSRQPPKR